MQGKSRKGDILLFRVRLWPATGPEREFEPPCERGTPLTALDPVRGGALLCTHQKRRMSPFLPLFPLRPHTPSARTLPTSGELNWKLSVVNSHLIAFTDSVDSPRLSGAVRNYPSELVLRSVGEVKSERSCRRKRNSFDSVS